MIEIHFALAPLREVTPWPTGGPHLSWYGLSQGWYVLRIGGYRNVLDVDDEPVDYQVVRLLEDLIDVMARVITERSSYLDLGYLSVAPALRFDREDDHTVVLHRLSPGDGPEEIIPIPSDAFFGSVVDFGKRLLDAMEERCTQLVQRGGIPGVAIDLDALQSQQRVRRLWFEEAVSNLT